MENYDAKEEIPFWLFGGNERIELKLPSWEGRWMGMCVTVTVKEQTIDSAEEGDR